MHLVRTLRRCLHLWCPQKQHAFVHGLPSPLPYVTTMQPYPVTSESPSKHLYLQASSSSSIFIFISLWRLCREPFPSGPYAAAPSASTGSWHEQILQESGEHWTITACDTHRRWPQSRRWGKERMRIDCASLKSTGQSLPVMIIAGARKADNGAKSAEIVIACDDCCRWRQSRWWGCTCRCGCGRSCCRVSGACRRRAWAPASWATWATRVRPEMPYA